MDGPTRRGEDAREAQKSWRKRGRFGPPSHPLAVGHVCCRNGIQPFEAHILQHKGMSASRQRNNARAGMVQSNSTAAACPVVALDRFRACFTTLILIASACFVATSHDIVLCWWMMLLLWLPLLSLSMLKAAVY